MSAHAPSRHVVTANGGDAYSPANHTGTSNRRVISRGTVGARHVEVLIGTIVKGNGALRHAHPTLEQASYMLEGEGLSEVDGVERVVTPGRWKFNPKDSPHRFTVTSDAPVKVIVVYAPPYAENPQAAVLCDDFPDAERIDAHAAGPAGRPETSQGHGSGARSARGALAPVAAQAASFVPAHHAGTTFRPAITRDTMGAMHMAVYEASFTAAGGACAHALEGIEKVIHVRGGGLAGEIDGTPFHASAGDWIFIPENATHAFSAQAGEDTEAFVILAGAIPATPNP